jgi:hypothetical protein
MQEPLGKSLGRRKPPFNNIDPSQPSSSSKRTRITENQNNNRPTIANLTSIFLFPPHAPVTKQSAVPTIAAQNINGRTQLEDSDSETEISKLFARNHV